MKKRGILQRQLAETIAALGHGDLVVVGDAGLPVPVGVPCIDLAVRCGVPAMLEVTTAIADEMQVEAVTIARELVDVTKTCRMPCDRSFRRPNTDRCAMPSSSASAARRGRSCERENARRTTT